MAGFTGLVGDDMRRCLTRRRCAVMTTGTGTDDCRVINPCNWTPQSGAMTGLTGRRRLYVLRMFTRRRRTIMTTTTRTGNG